MIEAAGQSEVRYLDYQGVYFLMVSQQEFEEAPYCRKCLKKMTFVNFAAPYLCPDCRAVSPFTVSQFPRIRREIEALLREVENPG